MFYVVDPTTLKSESGRSDPPRQREQRRLKEATMRKPTSTIAMTPPGVRGRLRPQSRTKTSRDLRLIKD